MKRTSNGQMGFCPFEKWEDQKDCAKASYNDRTMHCTWFWEGFCRFHEAYGFQSLVKKEKEKENE